MISHVYRRVMYVCMYDGPLHVFPMLRIGSHFIIMNGIECSKKKAFGNMRPTKRANEKCAHFKLIHNVLGMLRMFALSSETADKVY